MVFQIFLQTILLLLINSISGIKWCALFFTLALSHSVYWSRSSDFKKAFIGNLLSCLFALAIFWNKVYLIRGNPVHGLCIASYLSIFLSFSLTLGLVHRFHSIVLPVLAAIIFDAALMGIFFIPLFSMERIISIFFQEVLWKSFYFGLILSSIYGIRYLLEKRKAER